MAIITYDEYKTLLEKLLLNGEITENEINSTIDILINQTPFNWWQLKRTPFLIRASLLDEGEICSSISRCSYVPNHLVKKIPLGRCNFKEQQIFYACIPGEMQNFSDGAQPALMETLLQKLVDEPKFNGRIAAVSRWQVIKQPIFGMLLHNTKSRLTNKNFAHFYNEFDNDLKVNSVTESDYICFSKKLKYLSELFCKNDNRENTYKVTATYYNKMMAGIESIKFDGLIYPSANTDGEGMNIALTKEFVDKQSIYSDLVILYSINRNPANPKNINFIPIKQAVPDEFGNLDFNQIIKN